ncbi:MAG: MFS transporter [Myxococcota bacterium]
MAAGAGIQTLAGALLMQSYGAYFVLLGDEFGWSKALLAGAFAMSRIESGILGPLQGWLIDRFGPRAVMRVGLLTFGVGFMLFSLVDSLLTFYLVFFLLAVGSSLGGFVSVAVSLVHWFNRHRAKAVAISQSGFSLGGLLVPVVIFALSAWGWRVTAFASGVLVLVVGLPLAQVVRHRPEQYGETADGLPSPPRGSRRRSRRSVSADGSEDFTAREAMRTSAFWLISLGHSSALLVVSAVMVHMVPHVHESLGYSLATAGYLVALMTAMQLLGQLSGGYLGDRFDKRVIIVCCMAAHGSGLLLLAYASSLWMVVGFALLHGWAWGTRGPLMVAIRADYFGASSFGTIMGFSSLIVMLGMTVGPILAGVMADRSGRYTEGLALLAVASLVGSFFFVFAKKPVLPRAAAVPEGAVPRAGG